MKDQKQKQEHSNKKSGNEDNKPAKERRKTGKGRAVARWLAMFFTIFFVVVALSLRWAMTTWSDLDFEEILFNLSQPLTGTGGGMIGKYIAAAVVPAAVLWTVLHFLLKAVRKRGRSTALLSVLFLAASFAACAVSFYNFAHKVNLTGYIEGQQNSSTFIEDNYVNPSEVNITFPEKKRNLIYIYMESTEITFADEANGGAFPQNVIPELTQLAEENEDFAGSSDKLDGGIALSGATWTMGAMFAQTSGLPLKISIGANNMDAMDSFFPNLTTLGDILNEEGYDNTLMIGSDATFGGRRLYFTEHGNYNMQDYVYAKEQGLIPEDYHVWWGYEDEKLFQFAKDTITEKAAGSQPFNVTLLTVDTHFEDGYVCDLCPTTFGDNQYANVYACASRQVSSFVQWCQKQDWYDDTTIIISGDHPTMDKDFCENVPKTYQRKVYTCYINADAKRETSGERLYSTFDDFPTTIAALGAEIEGNRLGLGTNLYSSEQTILEKYGGTEVTTELKKKSAFLENLEKTDITTDAYRKRVGTNPSADISLVIPDDGENCEIHISNIVNVGEELQNLEAEVTFSADGAEEKEKLTLELQSDGDYTGTLKLSQKKEFDNSCAVKITGTGASGTQYTFCDEKKGLISLLHSDPASYLKALKKLQHSAVIISVMDEASRNRTEEEEEALNALGLSHLPGFRQSYLGLVDHGRVLIDETGSEMLQEKGTLADGTEYSVSSAGYEVGDTADITLNGTEILTNPSRGFNIVVYDEKEGIVTDTVALDVFKESGGQPAAAITVGSRRMLTRQYVVTVANISGCDNNGKAAITGVSARVWSEDDPEHVEVFSLDDVTDRVGGDLSSFSNRINLKDFKGKTVYIDAVVTNSFGQEFHVGKVTENIV